MKINFQWDAKEGWWDTLTTGQGKLTHRISWCVAESADGIKVSQFIFFALRISWGRANQTPRAQQTTGASRPDPQRLSI